MGTHITVCHRNRYPRFYPGKKLEFKIISLNADRVIEWEAMPDNLNRKFRVVEDVLLDITWGDSKGRKKLSSTRSQASTPRELSPDLERVLKYKPKKSKREGNFNPFDDAYNSEVPFLSSSPIAKQRRTS